MSTRAAILAEGGYISHAALVRSKVYRKTPSSYVIVYYMFSSLKTANGGDALFYDLSCCFVALLDAFVN